MVITLLLMCTERMPPRANSRRASTSGGRNDPGPGADEYDSWPMPVSTRLIS